jgi:crotonobetainyl-CoA:carnitine CoA-transferase CaiB-like acyl-CoA transferase
VSGQALPLRGIRVANFGVGGVAPWASSLLAQMGATVVKIEAPNEFIMYTLPPWRGLTTTYAALNANVRSVKLNLKDGADRELAWILAGTADVMVENFRSGAIDRMGFGFDALAARNPRIIFCSSSGYGRNGEMAGLPCTDPHMQAFSGFAALNGEEAGGERIRYYGLIDLYCGHLICEAVLAALVARRRDQKPQYIEMTMLGGATSALMTRLASRLRGGPAPTHRPVRHCAPDGLYPTADGTIALTVEDDGGFKSLCTLIGRAELASDSRFALSAARLANAEALDAELRAVFLTAPCDWWLIALGRGGIACGRVHCDHDVAAHRDTWRRGHLREIHIKDAGTLRAAAPAWDFEGVEPVRGFAPRPGEHSDLLRRDPANFWTRLEKEEH